MITTSIIYLYPNIWLYSMDIYQFHQKHTLANFFSNERKITIWIVEMKMTVDMKD